MEKSAENKIVIIVNSESGGARLDKFVVAQCTEDIALSRNYIEKLIENGNVAVNGNADVKKNLKLKEGDEVTIELPEPESLDIESEDIPIEVVHEDDDVIVVNKARGMVVHPGPGNWSGTLVNALMHHAGESLSSINGVVRPGIVHRIDKDTSGLLVIAKNDKAHESLASQLEEHSMTREYWAICYDNIKEDEIAIDEPIGRDPKNRLRRAVHGQGERNAITHVRVLERYGKYTLISAALETGRTHQIRVHMAYIKHPLAGDRLYGPKHGDSLFKIKGEEDESGTGGQILHAKKLGFKHPSSGEYMEFDSELPEYFKAIINKLVRLKDI